MEVIRLQATRGRGTRGKIVNVKPWYARNYRYPQSVAAPATGANQRWFESQKKKLDVRHAEERQAAAEVAAELTAIKLRITKRASETGTLYGSVSPADVVEALAAKGFDVDRRWIDLPGTVKSLGDHSVRVDLHPEIIVDVAVEVLPET